VGGACRSARGFGSGVGSVRSQILGSIATADAHAQRRFRVDLRAGHSAALLIGQDAGLIHDIPPAAAIVERIVAEAEALLKNRLPGLCR